MVAKALMALVAGDDGNSHRHDWTLWLGILRCPSLVIVVQQAHEEAGQ